MPGCITPCRSCPPAYTLCLPVCYALFIYLLNLFLAFLQPKFDPSINEDLAEQDMEDGEPGLPTSASAASFPRGGGGGGLMSGMFGATQPEEEFRPFIRRLPEFKVSVPSARAIGADALRPQLRGPRGQSGEVRGSHWQTRCE